MAEVNAALVEEYLRLRPLVGLTEPYTIRREAPVAGERRFRVVAAASPVGAVILKRYEPGLSLIHI